MYKTVPPTSVPGIAENGITSINLSPDRIRIFPSLISTVSAGSAIGFAVLGDWPTR